MPTSRLLAMALPVIAASAAHRRILLEPDACSPEQPRLAWTKSPAEMAIAFAVAATIEQTKLCLAIIVFTTCTTLY